MTVVRRCVWSRNLKTEEAMARVGPQRQKKKKKKKKKKKNCVNVCVCVRVRVCVCVPLSFIFSDICTVVIIMTTRQAVVVNVTLRRFHTTIIAVGKQ